MNRIRGRVDYPPAPKVADAPVPRTREARGVAFDKAIITGIKTREIMAHFDVTNATVQGRRRRLRKLGRI